MKKDNIKLLLLYLQEVKSWVSAQDLATRLHTTTRTIRSYVREINEPKTLIDSSVYGYRWRRRKKDTPFNGNAKEIPQTPKDRKLYILREILWQEQVKIADLLDALLVSERTLDVDLNQLRRLFHSYALSLHRKKDILNISGRMSDRRRLIADCVYESNNGMYLSLQSIKNFAHLNVTELSALINKILARHRIWPDGYNKYDLLLRIVIQLEQIQRGNSIQEEEFCVKNLEFWPDYSAACELSTEIEHQYGVVFSKGEICYLAALLLAKTNFRDSYAAPQPQPYEEILEIVFHCLEEAGETLQLNFFEDNFPARIAHFLFRMTIRHQILLSAPSFLPESLRSAHPLLLDMAAQILLRFSSHYGDFFSSNETIYLALQLADYMFSRYDFETRISAVLLCPELGNLSVQLEKDIKRHLGDVLTIARTVTTMDIELLSSEQLIISVLPIAGFPHEIIISPMPKSEDYRIIRKEITAIKAESKRQSLSKYLNTYLRPDSFLMDAAFNRQKEFLAYACNKLAEQGAVLPGFFKKVHAREQMDPTSFFNVLAIPHECGETVKLDSLYILLNQSPMPWGKQQVNIVVLIAMSTEKRSEFTALYSLLTQIFSNPRNVQAILRVRNYDEFLEVINVLDI